MSEKKNVKIYFHAVEEVKKLVEEKGWELTCNLNKNFCSFRLKSRNRAVFGVVIDEKLKTETNVAIYFRLSPDEAKNIKITGIKTYRDPRRVYGEEMSKIQELYDVLNEKINVYRLLPLFEAAYK